MVERPIKKSERQSQAGTDKSPKNSDSMPNVESDRKSPKPRGNRSSGKGKKGAFEDKNKQQVNPALARGPKPVKLQASVKTEPESESETISEQPESESETTSEQP